MDGRYRERNGARVQPRCPHPAKWNGGDTGATDVVDSLCDLWPQGEVLISRKIRLRAAPAGAEDGFGFGGSSRSRNTYRKRPAQQFRSCVGWLPAGDKAETVAWYCYVRLDFKRRGSTRPSRGAALLSSAELSDLTPSPPAPLPQRGEGRVSSSFSCHRPLWGRGRRGEAVLPVAPGEGVKVSPCCAGLNKQWSRRCLIAL